MFWFLKRVEIACCGTDCFCLPGNIERWCISCSGVVRPDTVHSSALPVNKQGHHKGHPPVNSCRVTCNQRYCTGCICCITMTSVCMGPSVPGTTQQVHWDCRYSSVHSVRRSRKILICCSRTNLPTYLDFFGARLLVHCFQYIDS